MVIIGADPFILPKIMINVWYDLCSWRIHVPRQCVWEYSATKERFFVLSDKVAASCMWLLTDSLANVTKELDFHMYVTVIDLHECHLGLVALDRVILKVSRA